MKSVLITGVNSYIGTNFESFASIHYPNDFLIDTVDMIDDSWKMKDFSPYDIVFHVAGIAHADVGRVSDEIKAKYYDVNTRLAIETARKAKEDGVRQFVFMSSVIVYGESSAFGDKKIITKDTKPHPSNFYGDSKWRADKGIRMLADDSFKVAVLRPPMIYGKDCKGNYLVLAKMAKMLPIFPHIDNERSVLYIENFCEFLCQVMLREEAGVFHPQNAQIMSTSEMVSIISKSHNHRINVSDKWNWIVKLSLLLPGRSRSLANKAFGNLAYDKRLSDYDFDYQSVGFTESIYRTEKEGNINKRPLVSIVMATYNDKPQFIRSAINSIINQTYENFELLIIDDSTDDSTKSVIDSFASDDRVRILRESRKLGFVPSLNKGLSLSRGDYIARMDGDDISATGRLKKQVDYLQSHPKTDILGGQINIIDEDGNMTGSRKYPLGGIRLKLFFTVRTPVAHPTVMFRRKIVDDGYKYDESYSKAEDIDFWIRLYNAGFKFNNLSDTLVDFRVESGFMEKRVTDHAQEDFVLKARRTNFSWRHPIFSTADFFLSYIRKLTPDSLKAKHYEQENGNSN